jgi:hypothetical protein
VTDTFPSEPHTGSVPYVTVALPLYDPSKELLAAKVEGATTAPIVHIPNTSDQHMNLRTQPWRILDFLHWVVSRFGKLERFQLTGNG